MAWVKLTDVFPEDPKVEQLSHRAFRLHITALCHCARNLTDGRVTKKALKVVAASAGVAPKAADELVGASLWEANGDGYVIPKYLDYNPSADTVREVRAKRAESGRQGGLASGRTRSKP
jgi:hypothetical protein